MLLPILGTPDAERVLVFIYARDEGYARQISKFFKTSPTGIIRQLQKFEKGGLVVSNILGRTRLYSFNPRYPFLDELKSLLEKALDYYPKMEREKLLYNRRRPRKQGKAL